MSLFDDLLKQSAPKTQSSGQTWGNPPQNDPLVAISPITISDATPMVSVVDIVQPRIEVPAGTPMQITESNNSIIIDESVPEITMTAPIQPQEDITPITISDTSIAETSLLFDRADSSMPSLVDGVTLDTPETDSSEFFETPATQKEDEIVFHDTNTYIDHAIEEVSDLIKGIDVEDATTLAAEDEHRRQKEHFAELEIADEATHQKHLEERAHAEKMKKYLEKEQGVALKKNEEKEAVPA
jgi:hypothetical protein